MAFDGRQGVRRLVLSHAEMAELIARAGVTLPPGLIPDDVVPKGDWAPEEEQALAVNLAVLAKPIVAVRMETAVPGRVLRGLFSISGHLGASLFSLADASVELSLFNAVDLGAELLRAVPPAAGTGEPLDGVVDLADLEWQSWTWQRDDDLAARARQLTCGSLSALVTGGSPDGAVIAGQIAWLLTGDRWTGLRPMNDGSRKVRLEPVTRADFPVWVAAIMDAESPSRP
ncbi:hypothetical protein ACTI_82830 [Actinoplanes sp. OR16]|uniref:hypothetical protein n=1 Tax=Actinoplanes sp. OR16 TaxID=946334 RepID=UPI000F6F898A|nr:hypothetical protein [Actinoplanes sp. OR16]BBH71598.1 hypothetical protein ACTI_82830 [Actinoplanes sp. OR16]